MSKLRVDHSGSKVVHSVDRVPLPDGTIEIQVNGMPVHRTRISDFSEEVYMAVLAAVAAIDETTKFYKVLNIPAGGLSQMGEGDT